MKKNNNNRDKKCILIDVAIPSDKMLPSSFPKNRNHQNVADEDRNNSRIIRALGVIKKGSEIN